MASSNLMRELMESNRKAGVGRMTAADRSPRSESRALISSALMMTHDVVAVLVALLVSLFLVSHTAPPSSGIRHLWYGVGISTSEGLAYLAWFIVTLLVVSWHYGLYLPLQLRSTLHEQRMTAQACLTAGLLLSGGLYLTEGYHVSRSLVLFLVCFTAAILCARRLIGRTMTYREYDRGINTRNLVILGSNKISTALKEHISHRSHLGYTFRGFVSLPGERRPGNDEEVLGSVDQIRQIAKLFFIDELVIAEPCSVEQVISILEEAREIDLDVRVLPGYYESVTADAPIEYLGDFPVVALHRGHVPVFAMAIKRVFDIAMSLGALIAAGPVMIAIAIAIRLEDGGPVFYVSERVGKKGTVFSCYKFRSMVMNADQIKAQLTAQNERAGGILFKMKDDPRITKVGKFLRKYSLDELPQLFNVLQGDMSVVGPRPPIASEVAKYEIDHFRRLEVLPGLTGLWQVRARQDPSFERYIALDTAYVENWSFWLDLKIILMTAGAVVRGTGA